MNCLKAALPVGPVHLSFSTTGPLLSAVGLLRAHRGLAKWSFARIGLGSFSILTGTILVGMVIYEVFKNKQALRRYFEEERENRLPPLYTSIGCPMPSWQFGLSILSLAAGTAAVYLHNFFNLCRLWFKNWEFGKVDATQMFTCRRRR